VEKKESSHNKLIRHAALQGEKKKAKKKKAKKKKSVLT
jgi:hypothetical protein